MTILTTKWKVTSFLMQQVELPSVTNEELENTVDDLSANLTEGASTEEIVGKFLTLLV